ncbi:MAG TPA: LysM domain-containing protein [Gemmatimonadaceae bacterium]
MTVVVVIQLALHLAQSEPRDARALTERELRLTVLQPGERVRQLVSVFQRSPLNYYRATRGVLVLTDKRLIYLGLVPRDLVSSPDAPPAFMQRDFPIDTTTNVRSGRTFFQLARGLVVDAPSGDVTLAVPSNSWANADSLRRILGWEHAANFAEGRRRVAMERAIAATREAALRDAKKPRYHVVSGGEALGSIANLYGTTPELLRTLNDMGTSNTIKAGQRLLVKKAG